MTLAMGLFDGTLKEFGQKLVTAFSARAELRRKIAQEQDKANGASHRLVAIVLDDVADVIKSVAGIT